MGFDLHRVQGMEILSWILFGFVVGLVARALMPGSDSMGFVGTTVLGVLGALLGGWFSRLMQWSTPTGFGTLLSATIGAIVVLTAVNTFQRRSQRRRAQVGQAGVTGEAASSKEKGKPGQAA